MGWSDCCTCCRHNRRRLAAVARSKFYCCDSDGMQTGICNDVELAEEAEFHHFEFVDQYSTETVIRNPTVPFQVENPVTLHVGRTITIEGTIHKNATRLSINLACGSNLASDIAFHLNPRFDQNCVVRNSRVSGHWGKEEVAAHRKNPFKRGKKFCITIFVAEEQFLVAVNEEHLCAFTFRIALQRVVSVAVHGDVDVDLLEHGQSDVYPYPDRLKIPEIPVANKGTSLFDSVIENWFIGRLLHPPTPGTCLELTGRVKLLPHSFYLNLQCGNNIWPHPIIALHVNPRFKSGSGRGVALNSWKKDKWGHEMHYPSNLFRPGRDFCLRVQCTAESFLITIDGEELASYKHKVPYEDIDTVYIQGDLFIYSIFYRYN